MKKLAIAGAALATAAALVAATPAGATHEGCNGTVTQQDTPAGTFYVDDRGVDGAGVWIYQESNGIAGLQSGGESSVLGDLDVDDCTHETPDTLIF
jgi:hypothetical protein